MHGAVELPTVAAVIFYGAVRGSSAEAAVVLSIHARVAGTEPASWEDPSLVVAEAQTLPLPGLTGRIVVRWDE